MAHTQKRRPTVVPGTTIEDGDFLQLRLIREQRSTERKKRAGVKLLPRISDGLSEMSPRLTPRDSSSVDELFLAIDEGDKNKFDTLFRKRERQHVHKIKYANSGESVLLYALTRDNLEIAKYLIKTGSSSLLQSQMTVNRSGSFGKKNALHFLIEINNLGLAKLLLDQLPNREAQLKMLKVETAVEIQGQRPRLFSCLHLAAYFGHTDFVELCIAHGMDVNHENSKRDTALLWAARWGHTKSIMLLLKYGADPDIRNDKGSTALHWAVRYGHAETVELLLTKGGANPNIIRKLGLVAPVTMAAAYGYTDVMAALLRHPATEINFRIRGGELPIHHAAKEGCLDVLVMLIEKGTDIHAQDELGNTPLLLAAKHGHDDVVLNLIQSGSDIYHRNHEGHDAWYYAIESEDNFVLEALLSSDSKPAKNNVPPLCLAASKGRCDKVEFLLSMGSDPHVTDTANNTFIHYAASSDQFQVLDKFKSVISLDTENGNGNTPIHIACSRGHHETIKYLINCKIKTNIMNNKGNSALHVAAQSEAITPESVKMLLNYSIITHSWDCLNAKNSVGRNCLHIAAIFARPDVLWEFRVVRSKDTDNGGCLPLHLAVRPDEPEVLEVMLNIFESTKRDARINEQTYELRETVLHLAAVAGLANGVSRLINLGADVGIKDINGNSVLHRLIIECANDTESSEKYLNVFDIILKNSVSWWCKKKSVSCPVDDNRTYKTYLREAVLYISNKMFNNQALTVLDLAFKLQVPDIVSRLLMMEDVTMYSKDEDVIYSFDITDLIPRTCIEITRTDQSGKQSKKIAPMEDEVNESKGDSGVSALEWLLIETDRTRTAAILDLPPLKLIESYYSSMVARTFAVLMVFHIVYMSVFTYIGVDLLRTLRNDETKINATDAETILLYAIVPVEPLAILIYSVYSTFRHVASEEFLRQLKTNTDRGITRIISLISPYMLMIVLIVYAALVIIWIVLFSVRYEYQDNILAMCICIGWLMTIFCTRGIKPIHYFYRMLLSIISRDIVRFIVVYLFVLLAFGFAFHILFQVSEDLADNYETPADTLFLSFNMMIGMGDMFDDNFESSLHAVGRNTTYIKIFYLAYMILGTIILLNLLIAMMNDSYAMILQLNQVTWRIESVRLGMEIERKLPFTKFFASVSIAQGLLAQNTPAFSPDRWYINLPEYEFYEYMSRSEKEYSGARSALSKRLDKMEHKMEEFEKQTLSHYRQITTLLEKLGKEEQQRRKKKKHSVIEEDIDAKSRR